MRDYQQTGAVDTLYEAKSTSRGVETVRPFIEVTGGAVNIRGSLTEPTTPATDMPVMENGSAFEGIEPFAFVPNYLYFEDVSGTPVVTVSGVVLKEVV